MNSRIKRWWTRLARLAPEARAGAAFEPSAFAGSPRHGDNDAASKPWLDLPTLMSIESLELRVRRLVQGMQRGIHRSVRRGYSNEFSEYRPYVPGDDLRHMDWRRMARTDRPYIRQYEDESEWGCLVVVDLSASMAFGSLSYSKADYGRTLAGTLGAFLHGQGDAVGLLRFAADAGDAVPVRRTQRQMSRWWSLLAAEPGGDGTGLGVALDSSLHLMRRPGLVVVVSDFLANPEAWREPLGMLRAARHQVVFLEVLDPQEINFDYQGDQRFEMLEGNRRVDVDATQVREGYLERLQAHRAEVCSVARSSGADLFEARTDMQMEPLLRSALSRVASRRSGGFVTGAPERGGS
jgi:uncharacterized protein (DUF58 family)